MDREGRRLPNRLRLFVTISGDLTRDELLQIAESLDWG